MRALIAAIFFMCALPAWSQVGIGMSPEGLGLGRRSRRETRAAPLARALDQVFGPEIWTAVELSTAGPVAEMTQLVKTGYYKREIIQLILLAAEGKHSLKQVLEKRKKEEKLSKIAGDYGLDYDALYEEALGVEDILDREYLPRFEEKPRNETRP